MKPDCWRPIYNHGKDTGVWRDGEPGFHAEQMLADHEGRTSIETAYASATIRKWLEEVTEESMLEGLAASFRRRECNTDDDYVLSIYRAMIAAKLQELEGGE